MRCAVTLVIFVFFQALCLAADPSVDIKCNGSDTGVVIDPGMNAKIDFTVTAGSGAGMPVDIWVVMKTPFGFFSYDGLGPYLGWNYGLGNACFTGPLADMTGTALDHTLPEGAYKAFVGIDTKADGVLNLSSISTSDRVDFFVGPYTGMALIPAGEFEMGDHYGVGDPNELPVHTVYIDAFLMDIYEVTNQRYCDFLNSAYGQGLIEVKGGFVCKAGSGEIYCWTTAFMPTSRITWNGSVFGVTAGKENHPMAYVSWYGGAAFANWRSVRDGLDPCYDLSAWECRFGAGGYRLPTEAEWEYAARGGERNPYYKYPWGNDIDGSKANYDHSGDPYETGPIPWTTPVGYYDGNQIPPGVDMANGYGLYDMAGNVWEWCNDWYDENYYSSSPYNNPHGPASSACRVVRGGSWHKPTSRLRCATRGHHKPDGPNDNIGFRLALELVL